MPIFRSSFWFLLIKASGEEANFFSSPPLHPQPPNPLQYHYIRTLISNLMPVIYTQRGPIGKT